MDTNSTLSKIAKSQKHVQDALDVIQESFHRYDFNNTCVSFNGGKDCTALLHLVLHTVEQNFTNNNNNQLRVFYAQLPDHFQEEDDFVRLTVDKFNLKLMQYPAESLKEALRLLKKDAPSIEAIFIGTRSDDLPPSMAMQPFAPTDPDWPNFMRINPILDWSYKQVWALIRELSIPYCDLYLQGYSSIGTKSDTVQNPNLLMLDINGKPYYLPAWNLVETSAERNNRSLGKSNTETDNKETNPLIP